MKNIIVSLIAISILGLSSCTEDKISQPDLTVPEIVEVLAPAVAFIAETTVFQAVIDDPQGAGDISSAVMTLHNPASVTHILDMRDDGLDGDIIADDGQFVVALTAEEWQFIGMATFFVTATDADGNSTQSDTVTVEVLPGSRGSTPQISALTFADSIRIDSSYSVQLLAAVQDEDGLANIDSVIAGFYKTTSAAPFLRIALVDDGNSDDGIADNGIYGAVISSSENGFVRTSYIIRVIATDKKGNKSKAASKSFITTQLDEIAPEILSISVPDTISRTTGEPITLSARVADRNGLGDIRQVIFNTFRPDGTPSSGNPFALRDDGIKDNSGFGDATAGDGEYTAVITIGATNATGNYRFEFQAEDKSGLKSEKINHILTVIE